MQLPGHLISCSDLKYKMLKKILSISFQVLLTEGSLSDYQMKENTALYDFSWGNIDINSSLLES